MKPRYLFEEYPLVLILVIQTVLVALGVLSRYVFGWPLSFTEELTRYLLAWLACLGFSACWKHQEMLAFQWPGKKENSRLAILFRIVSALVTMCFFIIVLVASFKMIHMQWKFEQTTSVMGWPIIWVSLAFPCGCVLLFYRIFLRTRHTS